LVSVSPVSIDRFLDLVNDFVSPLGNEQVLKPPLGAQVTGDAGRGRHATGAT
jgi:hypothetical protein